MFNGFARTPDENIPSVDEAAGNSHDWALGSGTSEFAFTIELREGCQGGFLACPSDIELSGKEVLAGLLELSRAI